MTIARCPVRDGAFFRYQHIEPDRAGVDKEGGRHPLSVVRDDVGGRRQDGKY